jgi:hypothetical protein
VGRDDKRLAACAGGEVLFPLGDRHALTWLADHGYDKRCPKKPCAFLREAFGACSGISFSNGVFQYASDACAGFIPKYDEAPWCEFPMVGYACRACEKRFQLIVSGSGPDHGFC